MHRYSVAYIARDGDSAERIIYAHDRKSAREKAVALNLEDIKSVRRVGLSIGPFVVIAFVVVAGVFIFMQKG